MSLWHVAKTLNLSEVFFKRHVQINITSSTQPDCLIYSCVNGSFLRLSHSLLIRLFSKGDTYCVNPSVSANLLAGLKLGMCFVFVTFTGTEGNIDKGLIMCSRLGGHIYVSNLEYCQLSHRAYQYSYQLLCKISDFSVTRIDFLGVYFDMICQFRSNCLDHFAVADDITCHILLCLCIHYIKKERKKEKSFGLALCILNFCASVHTPAPKLVVVSNIFNLLTLKKNIYKTIIVDPDNLLPYLV